MDIKKFLAAKWWYEKGFTELTNRVDVKTNSGFDFDFYNKFREIQTKLRDELIQVFGKDLIDQYYSTLERNENLSDDEEYVAIKGYAELYQKKLQAEFDFWAITHLYQIIENADRFHYQELKDHFAESNKDGDWTKSLDQI